MLAQIVDHPGAYPQHQLRVGPDLFLQQGDSGVVRQQRIRFLVHKGGDSFSDGGQLLLNLLAAYPVGVGVRHQQNRFIVGGQLPHGGQRASAQYHSLDAAHVSPPAGARIGMPKQCIPGFHQ